MLGKHPTIIFLLGQFLNFLNSIQGPWSHGKSTESRKQVCLHIFSQRQDSMTLMTTLDEKKNRLSSIELCGLPCLVPSGNRESACEWPSEPSLSCLLQETKKYKH